MTQTLDGPLPASAKGRHTPEKIALSVALGITLGLFPIFGATTLLCVAAAVALRLSHPAIQVTNQLMYVVQIPLIVVFIRIGESMLGVAPIPFSATLMLSELRTHPALLFERFGTAGLHGILGWAAVAPFVVGLTYAALLPIVRVLSRRPAAQAAPVTGR
jgi:uncharacterized protein (DUF2062 family)